TDAFPETFSVKDMSSRTIFILTALAVILSTIPSAISIPRYIHMDQDVAPDVSSKELKLALE
ncbi:unnamed protein product, partial [Allacma fusca]